MRRRAFVSGATVVAVFLIGSCSTGNPASPATPDPTITTSAGPTTMSGPQRGSNAEVTASSTATPWRSTSGAERSPFA